MQRLSSTPRVRGTRSLFGSRKLDPLCREGVSVTPPWTTPTASLQDRFKRAVAIESLEHVSDCAARRRAWAPVPASPKMYPSRTRGSLSVSQTSNIDREYGDGPTRGDASMHCGRWRPGKPLRSWSRSSTDSHESGVPTSQGGARWYAATVRYVLPGRPSGHTPPARSGREQWGLVSGIFGPGACTDLGCWVPGV